MTHDVLGLARRGVHDERDDEAVQTQDFGENEDEDLRASFSSAREGRRTGTDHADVEPGLLGGAAHARVADDADCEARCETGETDGEAGAEVDEAGVERHYGLDWGTGQTVRSCEDGVGGRTAGADEHRDDEAVDLRGVKRR